MPNFVFYENVKKHRRNCIALSELEYVPLEFKFRRVRLHFTKLVSRTNRDKDKFYILRLRHIRKITYEKGKLNVLNIRQNRSTKLTDP